MQHSNIQKRHFTLVELMVAMGVLVIMMGFLFQFTIGAQRIWNASSKQTTSFNSAQVLMDVLNNDLQNMCYSNEAGETLPFYLHKDGNDVIMAFFADFTSSQGVRIGSGAADTANNLTQVGTYPVIYFYDSTNHKIHRCGMDRDSYVLSNGTTKTITNLWFLCGAEFNSGTDFFGAFKNMVLDTSDSLNQFDPLADNVTKFDISVFFGTDNDEETIAANKSFDPSSGTVSKHYALKKPVSIKLSFELETDLNAKPGEETKYSFSKVLFL